MSDGKIKGVLYSKGEIKTLGKEDRPFYKREFIVEEKEFYNRRWYTNFIKLFLTGNSVYILDDFNVGDNIEVYYRIRGAKWSKNGEEAYFTELVTDFIQHISEKQKTTKKDMEIKFDEDVSDQLPKEYREYNRDKIPTVIEEDDLPF